MTSREGELEAGFKVFTAGGDTWEWESTWLGAQRDVARQADRAE